MTASDDDTPVAAHRVIDGPPAFAWTDEPARGTDSREPGLRSLATRRNAVAFGGLLSSAAALFWLFGDPQIGGSSC